MADLRVDNTPPMAKVAYLFYQHRAGTGGSPSSDREMETGCYLPSPQVSSSSELPHPSPSHSRSPDTQGVEKRDTSHVASDGVRQRSYVNGDPILHQASISQSRGNHITTSHSRRSRRSPPAASQHASLQTVNLALAVGPSPGILKASGTRPDVGHRLGPNSAASTPNAPYPTSASLRTLRRSTTPHPSANPPPLYCYEAVHARSAENSAKSSSKRSGRRTPPSSSPQDRSSSHRLVSGRRPPPSSRYAKFQAGHTSSGAQLPESRRSARTFDDKPVQTDAESSAIPLPSGGAEVRTESPPSHVTLPSKDVGAQSALRSSPQPPFVMLPLKAGSSRMEAGSAVPRITSSRQDKTLFQGDGVRLGTRLVHPLSRSPTSPSRSRGSRPRFTGQLNATSNSLGQTPLSQRSLACVVPIQVPEGLMPPTVVAVASSIYPEDGLPAGETHLVKFEQGGRPDAFPVDEVPPAQVGARVMAHHSPQATPRDAELHSRFEVLHEPAELDAILAEALGTAVLLTEKELPPLPYERMSEHLFQQHDWQPIEQLSSVSGSDYEDTHPLLSTPSTHPSRHDESHRLCDGGAESDKRLSRLISKLTCGFIKPRIQNAPLDPQEEEKEKLWQKLLQRADAAGGTLYLDATNGRRVLKRAEQSTICFAA